MEEFFDSLRPYLIFLRQVILVWLSYQFVLRYGLSTDFKLNLKPGPQVLEMAWYWTEALKTHWGKMYIYIEPL